MEALPNHMSTATLNQFHSESQKLISPQKATQSTTSPGWRQLNGLQKTQEDIIRSVEFIRGLEVADT